MLKQGILPPVSAFYNWRIDMIGRKEEQRLLHELASSGEPEFVLTLPTAKAGGFLGAYISPFPVDSSPKLGGVPSPRPEPVHAVTEASVAAQAGRLLPATTGAYIMFTAPTMSLCAV